jgi:hypothetical protein
MFEQNDNKQTVRKSKSTVSRDHRRMEKYDSKTDNINQCVDISMSHNRSSGPNMCKQSDRADPIL